MKRIIHTFVIAFQFIILSAVLTACKEDDGNISSPQEATPSFFWEGSSFQLEADNGWSITRFANRVALSNFHQKCQYHLSWDGGSGAGEKTNGILKIAEAGKKLQTIRLDALLIEDINGMYYNIHFQKGEATGILLFSK
jgi:lipoprotein